MKLATIRIPAADGGDPVTRAVRLDGDHLVDLGDADLGAFLGRADWRTRAEGARTGTDAAAYPAAGARFAPPVPRPSKIVCVGLNYRSHILEMGRELPQHPTLFAKFADSLVGAEDEIVKPAETQALDWEAELAIVIGQPVRRAVGSRAEEAIAGFTVLNDVTARDWQYRTEQWLQGKAWDSCTPVGPYLVTPDELPGGVRPALGIRLEVDGEVMQDDSTADLLFDPVALVEYVSTIVRLNPGDIISTGTPGGVGHARTPKRHLAAGSTVETWIEGIGRLHNRVTQPPLADPAGGPRTAGEPERPQH